ncbi:MAG: lipase maturation factor family protein [Kofleriaceae bacterium]
MTDEPVDPIVDPVVDVRARSPLERLAAWLGPPRRYVLVRWLMLRLLGLIYVFAFAGIVFQGPALFGERGLTPMAGYVDQLHARGVGFLAEPSVFHWGASDTALYAWAIVGLVLSLVVLAGYANLVILLVLWLVYGSFVRMGGLWFSFGWEIQILETTVLAAFLVHPFDPRPLRARAPPVVAIVLMRWLTFRIMLGAGLIKLRGAACWTELSCLDAHFETQPIPTPLSTVFHHLPSPVLAVGVALNHLVEVVLPWFVFGPRTMRLFAGLGLALFQLILIVSGNLAFLNWLTLVPILACLDDDFVLRVTPGRLRRWLEARLSPGDPRDGKQLAIAFGVALGAIVLFGPLFGTLAAGTQVILAIVLGGAVVGLAWWFRAAIVSAGARLDGHQLAVGCLTALIAINSVPVVANLASPRQRMIQSYDRLDLVNSYGLFGSVTLTRHELVIEGTLDLDPFAGEWKAYELPCQPGPLDRRPCILGPYHRRLDWVIWFAAMSPEPRGDPWIWHLVWKLLDGDTGVRELLARDPFDGKQPAFVRIRRFRYHLEPVGADTYWTRDSEELWLPPIALSSPGFVEVLGKRGWPSPTRR